MSTCTHETLVPDLCDWCAEVVLLLDDTPVREPEPVWYRIALWSGVGLCLAVIAGVVVLVLTHPWALLWLILGMGTLFAAAMFQTRAPR